MSDRLQQPVADPEAAGWHMACVVIVGSTGTASQRAGHFSRRAAIRRANKENTA